LGTGSSHAWLIRECVATVSLLDLGVIFEGARHSDHEVLGWRGREITLADEVPNLSRS
jgi:hypothetical protein